MECVWHTVGPDVSRRVGPITFRLTAQPADEPRALDSFPGRPQGLPRPVCKLWLVLSAVQPLYPDSQSLSGASADPTRLTLAVKFNVLLLRPALRVHRCCCLVSARTFF